MTTLSVNVNKIATLRNARGSDFPNLCKITTDLISYGVKSITIHPRPDERHIKRTDVFELSKLISTHNQTATQNIEFNIEGYPSDDFINLVSEIKPDQCTLVPDGPNVITSNAGWDFAANKEFLTTTCNTLKGSNIRSSLFLDPFTFNDSQKEALQTIDPDRIELYTEAYAKDVDTISKYKDVAEEILALNIDLNAGHDLNLQNIKLFSDSIPSLKEVSIGHALICESLYDGFENIISQYHKLLGYD